MDPLTLSLIIAAVCATYYYFKKQLSYFEERGLPYAPAWPIFGNFASSFFRTKPYSEVLVDIYNSHPDAKYIGAFDFSRPVIVLRDPELIKTIAIKNFDSFHDHVVSIFDEDDPIVFGNLVFMRGERWKEARNLLSPAFTLSKMKNNVFKVVNEFGKNVVSYISELSDEDRQDVDTKDLFTRYTNDVLNRCAYGISIDSLKNQDNPYYKNGMIVASFGGVSLLKLGLKKMFPKVAKFFNIRLTNPVTDKFFHDLVVDQVKIRDETGVSKPDMIQMMMDARNSEKKYLKLDIDEMTSQAYIFYIGGFESSSTQMCFLAHELATNPEIQNKLLAEIDQIMTESDGNPSFEDIQGMAYLDAVFNESMRRHTHVFFLDRQCDKPFELPPALPGGKPFTIEPGTAVWIPATGIHMDPKYYENPKKFDPDRFYQNKSPTNSGVYFGFGVGPRLCIGYRFATLQIKVFFVHFLSKFKFLANSRTCSPMKYCTSKYYNLTPVGGFQLAIEPRN